SAPVRWRNCTVVSAKQRQLLNSASLPREWPALQSRKVSAEILVVGVSLRRFRLHCNQSSFVHTDGSAVRTAKQIAQRKDGAPRPHDGVLCAIASCRNPRNQSVVAEKRRLAESSAGQSSQIRDSVLRGRYLRQQPCGCRQRDKQTCKNK